MTGRRVFFGVLFAVNLMGILTFTTAFSFVCAVVGAVACIIGMSRTF